MNPSDMNDNLDARLRRALSAEADMVNPAGDGLGRIRTVIDERRRPVWWRNPAVALGAAAVLGLAAAAGAVALNDNGRDSELVATDPTPTSTPRASTVSASPSPTPSASPSPSPSQTASEPATKRVTVPVYFLGQKGTRLYREFHAAPLLQGDPVVTALTQMFTPGTVQDEDYSSPWVSPGTPQVKVLSVRKSGDTAEVNLSQEATTLSVGSATAELAIQQVVYTVTAADPDVEKVRLRVEGRVVPELWGHVGVGTKVFQRAPAVDVQGLIWLLSPKENETVGRNVQIKGIGTAFEGTISWEVLADGKVVEKGFTQGGANGEFGEFSYQVTLRPGTYVIRAFESSAEDGRPLHVDDKRFTVE